jgi:hypothetical protein
MATKDEWITARLAYLRGLKSPSELQRLMMLLADKPDRTPEEDRKLNAVVRAERAAVFAAKARMEATNIVNNKDRGKKAAEKKARDHRLIELGALFDLAGIGNQDRGALLGALLGMAKIEDADRWGQWKRAGDALLAERERKPKAVTAIQPPATSGGQVYNDREDSI